LGRPQRVFGAVIDITEARMATAALSAAQARLSLAAEVGGIASGRNLETGEGRWIPVVHFYGMAPSTHTPPLSAALEAVHPKIAARFELDWPTHAADRRHGGMGSPCPASDARSRT